MIDVGCSLDVTLSVGMCFGVFCLFPSHNVMTAALAALTIIEKFITVLLPVPSSHPSENYKYYSNTTTNTMPLNV